jgi:hypothetical protein
MEAEEEGTLSSYRGCDFLASTRVGRWVMVLSQLGTN